MSQWPMVRLRDVAAWGGGLTPSTADSRFWDGGEVPWISSKDVKQAQLSGTERRVTSLAVEETGLRLRPAGGVAVVVRSGVLAHTFPVAFVPFDCVVNQDVKFGVPSPGVEGRFLAAYLISSNSRILADYLKQGATVQSIEFERLMEMEIPLPPLDEQKRIVAKLDELDLLTKERQTAALGVTESGQDLLMGFLSEVFAVQARELDWPSVPFGEFAEHSLGKMLDKGKNVGEPRPYMRNANVQWFEIDALDVQEMRIDERERDRFSVRRDDLLICEGGYPGRCAIWNSDEEMYFQKALHRARFDCLESAKWAMYLLYFLSETGRLADHFSGTGIQHLTGERLARVLVPMPSAERRALLVEKIEGVHQAVVELTSKQAETMKSVEKFKRQTASMVLNGAA